MNKICTSLEQSKKLIELGIDVNTGDMCYCPIMNIDLGKNEGYLKVPECYPFSEVKDSLAPYLPAWSLTALLDIIPNWTMDKTDKVNLTCNSYYHCESFYEDPVDAAFEMVCWLLENGKL